MQVARLIEGKHERTGSAKLRQIIGALQLERHLSKKEILALYLRLAAFGGNIEGVRAASLAYFGKEPRRLSVGEAALLVALPQSPEQRRPDRNPKAARAARDRVLERAVGAGVDLRGPRRRAPSSSRSQRYVAISRSSPRIFRIRGGPGAGQDRAPADARPRRADGAREACRGADQAPGPEAVGRHPRRRPHRRAKSSRTSARPAISTMPAGAPST